MGILPTFYAHWRLNAMLRSWRTAKKILNKLDSFVAKNSEPEQYKDFSTSLSNVEHVLDKVIANVEDKVISELKERV